jgi:hypothetical protein
MVRRYHFLGEATIGSRGTAGVREIPRFACLSRQARNDGESLRAIAVGRVVIVFWLFKYDINIYSYSKN